MTDRHDFFEEDEPIEKVREAFDKGEKGLTGPPIARVREVFDLVRQSRDWSGNTSVVETDLVGQKSDERVRQAS